MIIIQQIYKDNDGELYVVESSHITMSIFSRSAISSSGQILGPDSGTIISDPIHINVGTIILLYNNNNTPLKRCTEYSERSVVMTDKMELSLQDKLRAANNYYMFHLATYHQISTDIAVTKRITALNSMEDESLRQRLKLLESERTMQLGVLNQYHAKKNECLRKLEEYLVSQAHSKTTEV